MLPTTSNDEHGDEGRPRTGPRSERAPRAGIPRHRRERGLFTLFEVMLATIILAMAATATALTSSAGAEPPE